MSQIDTNINISRQYTTQGANNQQGVDPSSGRTVSKKPPMTKRQHKLSIRNFFSSISKKVHGFRTTRKAKKNHKTKSTHNNTKFKALKAQKELLDELKNEHYEIYTNVEIGNLFNMADKYNKEKELAKADLFIKALNNKLEEIKQKEAQHSTSINNTAKQSITNDLKTQIANLRNAPDELDAHEDEVQNLIKTEDHIKDASIPEFTTQEEKPSINEKSKLIEMIKEKKIQTEDDSFDFESLQNEINNLNKENASGIILNMETWVEDNMYDGDDNYNEIKDNLDQASKTTDINEQKTYLNKAYNLMKNN